MQELGRIMTLVEDRAFRQPANRPARAREGWLNACPVSAADDASVRDHARR